VVYFKAYCGFMTLLYVLVMGLGVVLMLLPTLDPSLAPTGPGEPPTWVVGGLYAAVGLVLSVPYGLAIFVGQRPWVHIYGIILIGLTLTSCACIPIGLPLLLAWIKPEVKAWYQHGATS
jgi:hypothetical protein